MDFAPTRFFIGLVSGFGLWERLLRLVVGRRIAAVAGLTLRAAFRYRLFWVLAALLMGSVIGLPVLIKDDGTARGFTQILLTYTLSLITFLLGFASIWLACGTLARDIEDCQMQMVVSKPVARWQVWIGKWIGILLLNAILLTIAGLSLYSLMMWRASKLSEAQQKVLRNEILVARGSVRESVRDSAADIDRIYAERLKKDPNLSALDQKLVRKQIEEQIKASEQIVEPNYMRRWDMDLGLARYTLKDVPLYLRFKFMAAQTNEAGTYTGAFRIGPVDSPGRQSPPLSLAADTFHEQPIPPNMFDSSGKLTIQYMNWSDSALLFTDDDGMEVLYREAGFGLNFARGLIIIFCWIALMAAIGLACASLLSFPVAAFCSLSLLILGLSGGTMSRVLEEGSVMGVNHETGVADSRSAVDYILLPAFSGLLKVVNLVEGFSPVENLSTGRSISWSQVGHAFVQVVVLVGGFFVVIGIMIFNRRELAVAHSST
ncbi:MAG: ABC transporter permease [Opitutaceae bacterium]|nr:ABC transporter permease [Verrucomicrobiales bacterium]